MPLRGDFGKAVTPFTPGCEEIFRCFLVSLHNDVDKCVLRT